MATSFSPKQVGKMTEQIIKGNPPRDLPITSPYKSLLALNLKTAGIIDIGISPDVITKTIKIYDKQKVGI